MIEARLPDGTSLQFPDDTADAVIDKAVQSHVTASSKPPQKETGTVPEAVGDIGVSAEDYARVTAPPANPPLSLPTKDEVTKFLAPAPNTTYGDILPLAKDNTSGAIRLALPNVIRNPLMGLTEGPGTSGTFGSSGVTWNPETGTYGLTPEAASVGQFAATPLRFSGSVPANQFMPPGSLERKPLPADATALSPDAAARVRAAQGGTVPVAQPIVSTPFNTPPTTAVPGVSAEASAAQTQAKPTSLPTGVPVNQMAPSIAADGTLAPPGLSGEPAPRAASSVPTTSVDAFKVSDAFYNRFDQAAKDGGSLTPNVANKVVATVEDQLPAPGMAEAFGAGDELKGIVAKLQEYKDKPMSLLDVQAVDQQIGDLIHAENNPITGMSPFGRKLMDIQDNIREITEHPAASDVVGGQEGLDALAPARQAYSQAKKIQELERLWEKAQGKQNPTTSYQTSISNLFDNKRRSAGFSDEEKAAVKDAASRGVVGGGLHLLGSRLLPLMAAAAEGTTHGLTAGTAAFATTYLGGSAVRALENRLAASRFEGAKGFLGQRIPDMPSDQRIPTITVRPQP